MGCSTADSETHLPKALLETDAAVVYGKKHGRNQVVFFQGHMLQDGSAKLTFEHELKAAVQQGEILHFYQPIYCSETKQIVGFEALARWMRNGEVFASPDQFIPVAEETWIIMELGRDLIRQACRDVSVLQRAAGRPIWVSINLSGRQLQDEDIVGFIEAEAANAGIEMNTLKFEVTESVVLHDLKQVVATLDRLRARGVRIALDDFGTGYSSLSYLTSLPIDILKIDRSFVTAIERGTERFAIAEAIVLLASALGKDVIAEGIETWQEEDCLTSMGCSLLQGYRVSKPVPLSTAISLISPVPTQETCIAFLHAAFP